MSITSRFKWSIPDWDSDWQKWQEKFKALINNVDATVFGNMESARAIFAELPNVRIVNNAGVREFHMDADAKFISRTYGTEITIDGSVVLELNPGELIGAVITNGAVGPQTTEFQMYSGSVDIAPDIQIFGYVNAAYTIIWWNGGSTVVGDPWEPLFAAGGSSDTYKVKVDGTDTVENYLENKVVAGDSSIVVSKVDTGGGNKRLEITAHGSAFTDEKVKVSATDTTEGYLDEKLSVEVGLRKRIINSSSDEDILLDVVNVAGIYLKKHDVRAAMSGGSWFPVSCAYHSYDNSLEANSDGELNALGGIDGITDWEVGDRVVGILGYTSAYYGIYEIADLGSPTSHFKLRRPSDFDGIDNVLSGCYVYVSEGTYAGKSYKLSTTGKIILGTTTQTWDRYYGTIENENTIVVQKGGSAVINGENLIGTIALATAMTPYGASPSANNRIVVKIPAGEYDFGSSASPSLVLSSSHNYMSFVGEGEAWNKNEHDCPVVEDIVHPRTWIHAACTNGSYGFMQIQDSLTDFSCENIAFSNSSTGFPVWGYHALAENVRFKNCTFRVPELTVAISGISLGAVTTVTTSVAHNLNWQGQIVRLEGITGTTELNGRYFRIANISGSQFDLRSVNDWTDDIDSTTYTPYVSGGSVNSHSPLSSGVASPAYTTSVVGYNAGTDPTFRGSLENCHFTGSFYFQGGPSTCILYGSIKNCTFIGSLYDSGTVGAHIENCLAQGKGIAHRGGCGMDADTVVKNVTTWMDFSSSGSWCHGILENVWVKYQGFQFSNGGSPSTCKMINCRADEWDTGENAYFGNGAVIEGGMFRTANPGAPRFTISGAVMMRGVSVEKGKNDYPWIAGAGGTLDIKNCSIRDGIAYDSALVIVNGDGGDCARYPSYRAKEITVEVTDNALVNGENLYDAYQYSQSMLPGGSGVGPSNRLIFKIPAGFYNMDNAGKKTVSVGNSYIDIVGSGVARWKNITLGDLPVAGDLAMYVCPATKIFSASSSSDVSFLFAVNYTIVRGIHFISSYNSGGSNYASAIQVEGDYCVFEDCLFHSDGYFSNTTPPVYTSGGMKETWIDCHAISQSFLSSGGIQTCIRCTGGAHSFGDNAGGVVEGRYIDCKAPNSFGCELSGGVEYNTEFVRCYSNGKCFGKNGFVGKAIDCYVVDADSEPFGGTDGTTVDALLDRCRIEDLKYPIGYGAGDLGFHGVIRNCRIGSGDTTISMLQIGDASSSVYPRATVRDTEFLHSPDVGVNTVANNSSAVKQVDISGCTMPGGIAEDLFNWSRSPKNDAPPHGNARMTEFLGKAQTTLAANTAELLCAGRFVVTGRAIHCADNSTYSIFGQVTADRASSGECAVFKVECCVRMTGGVAAIIGTPVISTIAQSGISGAGVAVSITSSEYVTFTVTGDAANTIDWQGFFTVVKSDTYTTVG